jgi:hypothetical protein
MKSGVGGGIAANPAFSRHAEVSRSLQQRPEAFEEFMARLA